MFEVCVFISGAIVAILVVSSIIGLKTLVTLVSGSINDLR